MKKKSIANTAAKQSANVSRENCWEFNDLPLALGMHFKSYFQGPNMQMLMPKH
jgi:hypothetical protein